MKKVRQLPRVCYTACVKTPLTMEEWAAALREVQPRMLPRTWSSPSRQQELAARNELILRLLVTEGLRTNELLALRYPCPGAFRLSTMEVLLRYERLRSHSTDDRLLVGLTYCRGMSRDMVEKLVRRVGGAIGRPEITPDSIRGAVSP